MQIHTLISNKCRVWVLDNSGETYDRYTIILQNCDVYGADSNPFQPQGFGQYSHNIAHSYYYHAWGANWRKYLNSKKLIAGKLREYLTADDLINIGKFITRAEIPAKVLQYINQITNNA